MIYANKFLAPVWAVFLAFGCSQKLSSSSSASTAPVTVARTPPSQVASTETHASVEGQDVVNSNSNPTNSQIDPQSCYFNYVSIFAWENSADDADQNAPVLSVQKLATLKVYNSNQVSDGTLRSTLQYTSDTEWKLYFLLSVQSNGSSSLTSYLNKKDMLDGSTELTCALGPVFGADDRVSDPAARIIYQNIGVGLNGIDGFGGFLSRTEKFIACKISKGSQGVAIYGSENSKFVTHQAFVVKRGCYQ